jgi:hypothetical protein
MKTLILAMRLALNSNDFEYLRRHGGVAEDVLITIVKRNEGNELFLHYRKELIEIINITNQMNRRDIVINEDAERIAQFLLPPLPHEVKVQNFEVKDVPNVDKSFQRPIDQSFTTDGKVVRSNR